MYNRTECAQGRIVVVGITSQEQTFSKFEIDLAQRMVNRRYINNRLTTGKKKNAIQNVYSCITYG